MAHRLSYSTLLVKVILAFLFSAASVAAKAPFWLEIRPGLRLELAESRSELVFASGMNLGDDGAAKVAAALRHVPRLTTLVIDSSNITETGASALAAAFSSIPMLTTLNITWNDIGAKGGVAFAEALHHLELLETLNLCGCGIEDVGASELSVALVNVPWLVRLDVSYNNIHDDGLISLSSALHNVPQLQRLNANGNEHSSLGSSTLRAAAKKNVVVDTATRDELWWQGMERSIEAFGVLLTSVYTIYLFIINVQWCCCSRKDKSN